MKIKRENGGEDTHMTRKKGGEMKIKIKDIKGREKPQENVP